VTKARSGIDSSEREQPAAMSRHKRDIAAGTAVIFSASGIIHSTYLCGSRKMIVETRSAMIMGSGPTSERCR
jgi:hypothetical protein